ncbi:hypothetical protein [Maribacter sp. ACAM166]|nr:hypothetical protein [Maribacter sp. ACAM166]
MKGKVLILNGRCRVETRVQTGSYIYRYVNQLKIDHTHKELEDYFK